ncbi:MAG TPA: PspC domain-containing protein [Allosphingosinicella sp.]|jgi:phage shock protein C|nr:PspC domain-containing protein [Allosphingosinicella sp.]
MTTRNYALDKSNARILGVCAGLARSTGWDPTLVRIGAVALTLFLLGPLMILFYVIVGALAASR